MEITCRVYRPRRPRESPLFRLVEQHLEELLRVWPARFVRQHEWLREELLAPVPHRHVVLTIPRLLRPLFRRRRDLLTELARAAAEATAELVRCAAATDARPGTVVSIATAGDLLQWHPHLHLLTTDGGVSPDGSFRRVPQWDPTLLMSLFRQRLLARLLDRHAISRELVGKLLAWRHPGFSAHVGEPIEAVDRQRLEDTAAYLVRNPLSLRKLVYLDGRQAVLCRSRMNPSLGRNFEALDPLEWLARMSDHIPDPGQHSTLCCSSWTAPTTSPRTRSPTASRRRRSRGRWTGWCRALRQLSESRATSRRPRARSSPGRAPSPRARSVV